MKKGIMTLSKINQIICFTFLFVLIHLDTDAQQLQMSDFVLFSGSAASGTTSPASPGAGIQLSSSTSTSGGSIGSYKLVKTTGNVTMNSNIYCREP